jgi:hypothetical protein
LATIDKSKIESREIKPNLLSEIIENIEDFKMIFQIWTRLDNRKLWVSMLCHRTI